MLRGKKQPLTAVRIVFHLDTETAWPLDLTELITETRPATKGRGKKAKAAADAAAAAAQASGGCARPTSPEELTVPGATKVLVEEAAAVRSSCFEFKSFKDPIKASGRYGAHPYVRSDLSAMPVIASCPSIKQCNAVRSELWGACGSPASFTKGPKSTNLVLNHACAARIGVVLLLAPSAVWCATICRTPAFSVPLSHSMHPVQECCTCFSPSSIQRSRSPS